MKRRHSLRGRLEFRRLYAQGRAWSGAGLKVQYLLHPLPYPRFAVSLSRAAGNAVARNRVRRRIREAVRRRIGDWPAGSFHLRVLGKVSEMDFRKAEDQVAAFRSTLDG